MATDDLHLFRHYAGLLRDPGVDFAAHTPLPAALRMASDGRHEIYYAPFDFLNPHAKIVLVGIAPGRAQALVALDTARSQLLAGANDATAAAAAKYAASWSGPIRSHLMRMLDFLGVAARLGIASTAAFWTARTDLVHMTAAIRYPVFTGGKNYNGSGVDRSPLLLERIDTDFAAECGHLRRALVIPLGAAAQVACDRMVAQGRLDPARILAGLPHPSGANAERVAYFLGQKARGHLSAQTRPEPLDAAREQALQRIAAWSP
ncbi:hypothetical protein FIV34_19350 [Luteibacter pinisoli]|uniref:Uracil-DNA glycosylase-like domain-containing protein n=1 Tax=Luteibacter pinisoli TaxID=2589080 RepID=A0A4Y5ZAL8_9GAMM|nr:hypothetical protein [Luteibacter pinisoli]QDE41203.1 hypothetical protein FIV34_19350 [Luteibacter pinisoli]